CGSHSQGREGGRLADNTGDQIRTRHQSANRQNYRRRNSNDVACPRRRGDRVRRREFITLLGGAVVAWPIAARAQQAERVRRIGYVSGTGSAADPGPFVEALRQGMREHGYVDGKHFVVEYRGAEGRPARVPELIAELVQAKVDVLVTPFQIATL